MSVATKTVKQYKVDLCNEFRDIIENNDFIIFSDFNGLTVSESDDLRTKIRDLDSNVRVLRNRISRIAFEEKYNEIEFDDQLFIGNTIISYGNGNISEVAKVIKDAQKGKKISLKGAIFEGQLLNKEEVLEIAELPSREQLVGMLLNAMSSPITSLVRDLNQMVVQLPQVVSAIADKKND